jgi:ribosomal protein L35
MLHRALLRPLRVFLAGLHHPLPALPVPFSSSSGLSTLAGSQAALPLAPSFFPSRLALSPPPPAAQRGVRFGSRKAGSNGFKTKSAVKKRFRVTGGGALKRMSSGKRHLNLHKSSARIHRLGAPCACAPPLCTAAAPMLTPYSPPLPHRCTKNNQEQGPAEALLARVWPVALYQVREAACVSGCVFLAEIEMVACCFLAPQLYIISSLVVLSSCTHKPPQQQACSPHWPAAKQ